MPINSLLEGSGTIVWCNKMSKLFLIHLKPKKWPWAPTMMMYILLKMDIGVLMSNIYGFLVDVFPQTDHHATLEWLKWTILERNNLWFDNCYHLQLFQIISFWHALEIWFYNLFEIFTSGVAWSKFQPPRHWCSPLFFRVPPQIPWETSIEPLWQFSKPCSIC